MKTITPNTYLKVKENCNIVIKDGIAKLVCSEAFDNIKKIRLTPFCCIVLSLFNGKNTWLEICSQLSEIMQKDVDELEISIQKIVEMFQTYLTENEETEREFPEIEYIIKNVKRYGYQDVKMDQIPFPTMIYYSATNRCAFKCKYCYRDSSLNVEENDYLSLPRWKTLLEEAAVNGCKKVDIGGGDPFLRADILDFLKAAAKHDFEIKISTKMDLSESILEQLQNIPNLTLQTSLDSADEEVCYYLTGIKNSLSQALRSIDKGVAHQLNMHVNAVVTKYNIDTIPSLISLLEEHKVRSLSLTKYMSSCGRNDSNLYPDEEQLKQLDEYIYQYNQDNPFIHIEHTYSLVPENMNQEQISLSRILCGGGKDQLYIRHNGLVGFCDALLYDNHIIVGDLRKQSIAQAWNSPEMRQWLVPNKTLYKDTACFTCNLFEKCFPSRCFKRSILAYNTPYAIDPNCPKGESIPWLK